MKLKEWRQGEVDSDGESRGEEFGYRDDVGDRERGLEGPGAGGGKRKERREVERYLISWDTHLQPP